MADVIWKGTLKPTESHEEDNLPPGKYSVQAWDLNTTSKARVGIQVNGYAPQDIPILPGTQVASCFNLQSSVPLMVSNDSAQGVDIGVQIVLGGC